MNIIAVLFITILLGRTESRMPTVYEFCSHVVDKEGPSQATCDLSQCKGRPGKRGPIGEKGDRGSKGPKGNPGTAEHLERRIQELEASLAKSNQILESLPKSAYCYLGMKNREIPDSAITASSVYDGNHNSYHGRLDSRNKPNDRGAWAAKYNRVGEWLLVDLGKPTMVGGVISQGRHDYVQWIKTFTISCGYSSSTLEPIQESGFTKVFTANRDQDTKVINMFPSPISCRYIRVNPQSWNGHVSLRVEFIKGVCYDMYT
uniref:lactadherin-like isoform X3 n=1 Tax=Styela clava TaxID=7725 RepID=UPI001939F6E4|nr:lactadherin-like isoform X3 [Styela clava]